MQHGFEESKFQLTVLKYGTECKLSYYQIINLQKINLLVFFVILCCNSKN